MRVGIFDSGIGGLTVLNKLSSKYKNNDYIFFGDRINIPYGEKSKKELFDLSSKIIDFLISNEVDMIVIACGTVSSNCYKELLDKYKNINIVDIISPTVNYINNKKIDNILVIATSKTVDSHIFKNLLKDKSVYEKACPFLVDMIENNKDIKLEECINDKKYDYVLLGCTHYPLIKDMIKNKTIDLGDNIFLESNSGTGSIKLYFSKIDDNLLYNVSKILKDKKYSISLKVL